MDLNQQIAIPVNGSQFIKTRLEAVDASGFYAYPQIVQLDRLPESGVCYLVFDIDLDEGRQPADDDRRRNYHLIGRVQLYPGQVRDGQIRQEMVLASLRWEAYDDTSVSWEQWERRYFQRDMPDLRVISTEASH